MTMTLKQMIKRLPAARRKKVEERARELIADEMTLRDLRKARRRTQTHVAKILKIGQDGVSRLEARSDFLLSSLRAYVAAMGGSLDLVARFPDRGPVVISGLADLATQGKPLRRSSATENTRRGRKPRLTQAE